MQAHVIFPLAYPAFCGSVERYTVDPHRVWDHGQWHDGWVIRAYFRHSNRTAADVCYARALQGTVWFCPDPLHAGMPRVGVHREAFVPTQIDAADWVRFAAGAPHQADEPLDRLQEYCSRMRGAAMHWWATSPALQVVGWWPVVGTDGLLTGEVVEGSRYVSFFRLDPASRCVVLESYTDQQERLEAAGAAV